MRKYLVFTGLLLFFTVLALMACSGQAATPTPTLTPTLTPTPTPTSTATAPGNTAGQLASAGATVYAGNCAQCHGDKGQGVIGPQLIGSGNTLDKYGTAQGLYSFINSSMPLNAPGSLSSQQYLEITTYLLVQNNFVNSSTVIDQNHLDGISLK